MNIKDINCASDELMLDAMIRATRANHIDKDTLMDVFVDEGLSGVFNLGLGAMYKYLKDDNEEN